MELAKDAQFVDSGSDMDLEDTDLDDEHWEQIEPCKSESKVDNNACADSKEKDSGDTDALIEQSNRKEIEYFLKSSNLSHLLTEELLHFVGQSLNLHKLIEITKDEAAFDNFCHSLNIKLSDKIKIRMAVNGIQKKIDIIKTKNHEMDNNATIMKANNQIPCKVCVIGNGYVGKTSIISRFVNDEFIQTHHATYGVVYNFKKIQINEKEIIKFGLWDTSGQEMYYSTTIRYYKDANVVIIVYDGNDEASFEIAKQRLVDVLQFKSEEIKNNNKHNQSVCQKVVAVIANKCDLKKENDKSFNKHDKEIMSMKGVNLHLETSAKQNINIDKLFEKIITHLNVQKLDQFNKMIEEKNSIIVDGSLKHVAIAPNSNAKSSTKVRCCNV